MVGLIVLPFALAFKGGELLYKLGDKFVETISTALGKVWNEICLIPSKVKAGYDSVQSVPVRESSRTVLSFDDFLRRK
jgi:hypothetical protein